MIKSWSVRTCLVAVLVLASSCGGGGGGESAVAGETAGPVTTVSGKFVATDAFTPLGSALVYVENGKARDGATPSAPACGAAPDANWPATCSAADGSFTFDVVLPSSDATLVLVKNGFTHRQTLTAGRPAALALGPVVLDAKSAGSRIAVVFGDDSMQFALGRLGMGRIDNIGANLVYGTETFTLYDSEDDADFAQSSRNYTRWDALFEDVNGRARIYSYAIVLLNGGVYKGIRGNPAYRTILRDYVAQGGRLITAKVGYELIEDLWPTYFDWDGLVIPYTEPEYPISIGSESYYRPVYGRVEPALQKWMEGLPCTRYLNLGAAFKGTCFDRPSLFVVDDVPSNALPDRFTRLLGPHMETSPFYKTLVEGVIETEFGELLTTNPLAAQINVGAGRIGYFSFQVFPMYPIEGLTPHERVLQYMIFEM